MTSLKPLAALAPAAMLAACATTADGPGGPGSGPGTCDADAASVYVGQKATGQIGTRILQDTGARQLRWGPPGAAFTMDFRQGRVNVMYDEAMTITDVTCG